MFVRKFEADTLEEALKNIKHELGPEAIILKTTTNKGIKGAFKKKKIEITAAISQKEYVKKAKVDKVMDKEQKDLFYQNHSSYISDRLDNYGKNDEAGNDNNSVSSYGKIGLNKQLKTTQSYDSNIGDDLDKFLAPQIERTEGPPVAPLEDPKKEILLNNTTSSISVPSQTMSYDISEHIEKVSDLEKKIAELSRNINSLEEKVPRGISYLHTNMKILGIEDRFIKQMIDRALFELPKEEQDDPEIVFDFALQIMMDNIKVEMPLFSSIDVNDKSIVTILVSETSCGQTSMLMKLGTLKDNVILLKNSAKIAEDSKKFAEKLFNIEIERVNTVSELVTVCRNAKENGKSVLVDYRDFNKDVNETKKMIESLKHLFDEVEVLVCLSAIHSELYNKRIISRYKNLSNGMIISHMDLCMNYGALFNLASENQKLPIKFFGTGDVVPDDLEPATAERIIGGIFNFD